jgi:hypothetical protein
MFLLSAVAVLAVVGMAQAVVAAARCMPAMRVPPRIQITEQFVLDQVERWAPLQHLMVVTVNHLQLTATHVQRQRVVVHLVEKVEKDRR